MVSICNAMEFANKGKDLTIKAARILEKEIERAPDDLQKRAELLGYYKLRGPLSSQDKQARQQHLLWFINHYPDSDIAGSFYALPTPDEDQDTWERGAQLWLQQAARHPHHPKVLSHASRFWLNDGRKYHTETEALLCQAVQLDPNNYYLATLLAHLYTKQTNKHSGQERKQWALRALQVNQQIYQSDSEKEYKRAAIYILPCVAFEAEQYDLAYQYASLLLEQAGQEKQGSFCGKYGTGVHYGNLILGRLALLEKRREVAKGYLQAMGNAGASVQLEWFGPNMLLAKELLALDEVPSVLEYLSMCYKYGHRESIDKWISAIQQGVTPDFGASLNYPEIIVFF